MATQHRIEKTAGGIERLVKGRPPQLVFLRDGCIGILPRVRRYREAAGYCMRPTETKALLDRGA